MTIIQQGFSSPGGSTTRWVLIAFLTAIILVGAWIVRGVLMLMLASIILVVVFTLPVRFFIRLGLSRGLATLLSLLLILLIVAILFSVALPELIAQFDVLLTQLIPEGFQRLLTELQTEEARQQYQNIPIVGDFLLNISGGENAASIAMLLEDLGPQIAQSLGQIGGTVIPVIGGVADVLLSLLVVVFLSLYLLADPEGYMRGAVRMFPVWYRPRVEEIFGRLDLTLRSLMKTTIVSMGFVGVVTWFFLAILGIEQAAALGVLAGILSFIPNFGPMLTLIPAIAVGVIQAPDSLGWIVLIVYGASFLQSQIVSPLLIAGSVNIPPIAILLGQIICGAFLGFLGLMLAVQITAIVLVIVREVYIKDMLGDKSNDVVVVEEKTGILTDDELLPDMV